MDTHARGPAQISIPVKHNYSLQFQTIAHTRLVDGAPPKPDHSAQPPATVAAAHCMSFSPASFSPPIEPRSQTASSPMVHLRTRRPRSDSIHRAACDRLRRIRPIPAAPTTPNKNFLHLLRSRCRKAPPRSYVSTRHSASYWSALGFALE